MIQHDPRNKLATAHMVLYSLAHDRCIDRFSMGTALKEIDDFIAFLNQNERVYSCVSKIIELLLPGRKIIDLHLADDSSIKEVIEVALGDFNKAVEMVGDILEEKLPAEDTNF